jgi:hypothetical protein
LILLLRGLLGLITLITLILMIGLIRKLPVDANRPIDLVDPRRKRYEPTCV